jgi:CheY-like chemotaxis protein
VDRVLIVDDNHPFLEAARMLLEREGLTVTAVASSTAEALRSAEASPPDVVLVDVALGEESGLDLARRLADADGREGPTVILISTHTQADFADVIAESSAAGFLPKAELSAAAIRRIVEGGSS